MSEKRAAPQTEDENVTKRQLTEALRAKDDQIARLEATVNKLVGEPGAPAAVGKQEQHSEPPSIAASPNNPTVPEPVTTTRLPSAIAQHDIQKGAAETTKNSNTTNARLAAPQILERGHIYFFYRPKVTLEEAHNLDDVQRFYILLSPNTVKGEESNEAENEAAHRILIIPKKTLPSPTQHDKFYAIVAQVTKEVSELQTSLGAKKYETRTQGERDLEAARILGQGVYAVVLHHTQTHLAYVLEYPEDLSEAQKVFNIGKESSFQLSMKNPTTPQPANLNSSELFDQGTGFSSTNKVKEFPEKLQSQFRGNRWCPANPPTFLDHVGAEMLFIGANESLVDEFGEVGKQLEAMEQKDISQEESVHNEEPRVTRKFGHEDTFAELRNHKLVQPIIHGAEWNVDK